MKTKNIFTSYLLCAALLFTGCVEDPIYVAQPTVTITGTYELHTGDALSTLTLAGSVEYNGQQMEGTLAWKDASTTYQEAGEQQAEWRFTPADKSLYAVVEGKTGVTVVPSVYACGIYNYSGTKVWKNGNIFYEQPNASFFHLLISEGNIFTTGYTKKNGNRIIRISKNGTLLYTLTDGTYDAGWGKMEFSDGHIYICGCEKEESQKFVAKIWKDDTLLYELTDGTKDAEAMDIAISDGHIYTCGYEEDESQPSQPRIAKIWKDENLLYTLNTLTNNIYEGNITPISLEVVNGTLYTAGYDYNIYGRYVVKVWKNNKEIYTTDESLSNEILDMVISNEHIYLCVKESNYNQSGYNCTIKVLKDGKLLYKLTDGSHFAHAYSMVVSGGDVYTCGFEDFKTNVRTGKIWKNDTLLYSTDGIEYTDIAVN